MRFGVSGMLVPAKNVYADAINRACIEANFSPCWAYAEAFVESIVLELDGAIASAEKCTSQNGDGGFGILQITQQPEGYQGPWPFDAWDDAYTNAHFALQWFLKPAIAFWNGKMGYVGDDLVRCVAAEFNAGRGAAQRGHAEGNVGKYTENGDYDVRVVSALNRLIITGSPGS